MNGEKVIAVARVKSNKGLDQRIEMLTSADIVHLFALAMGYRPEVAFALGVISRSVPEIQTGESDLNVETARNAIGLAELISHSRQTQTLPEDPAKAGLVLQATTHVHTIEDAYTHLCENIPEILATFEEQYEDWCEATPEVVEVVTPRKASFLRRIFNRIAA